MFCPAKKGYTEEDYYFSEWTPAERENGEHLAVMKFVRPWNPSRFVPCSITAGLSSTVPNDMFSIRI